MDEHEKEFAIKLYKYLPAKDCGVKSPCGMQKCRLFALKVLRGEKHMDECPYLEDTQRQGILLVVDEYFN